MSVSDTKSAEKFDPSRAGEYDRQSRIALAGYEACHELTACVLAAALEGTTQAEILIAGVGTGQEVLSIGALEPGWRFTASDPSSSMLDIAKAKLTEARLADRTEFHLGYVDDLRAGRQFDGATLIGVLHHLPEEAAKRQVLASMAKRLRPGAPFVLACNHYAYASEPLRLAAWRQRWRMFGATPEEIDAKLGKIQHGAVPPDSEEAVLALLHEAGFERPMRFFSSLFWGAWIAHRR